MDRELLETDTEDGTEKENRKNVKQINFNEQALMHTSLSLSRSFRHYLPGIQKHGVLDSRQVMGWSRKGKRVSAPPRQMPHIRASMNTAQKQC